MQSIPAMFGLPGGGEWIIIGLIALLIFGRRLPDVARSVGKSIVEFKKGLRDVKDEIDDRSRIGSSNNRQLGSSPSTTSTPQSEPAKEPAANGSKQA